MEISLSKQSWHARYYNWVKGYYPTYEFKSLCPYFWTIISFILLLPVFLVWKGFKTVAVNPLKKVIVHSIDKALSQPNRVSTKEPSRFSKWYDKNEGNIDKWASRIYFGILLSIFLLVTVTSIVVLFQEKGAWLGFIYIFAIIGGITTFILSLWGIISFFETETWKMIKGMSYSAKNKVCPMITWEEK